VNVLDLWGVQLEQLHDVGVNLDDLCHCGTEKMKTSRNTANINTKKNLRSSITVKAVCSMTHLKQQKSFGFF